MSFDDQYIYSIINATDAADSIIKCTVAQTLNNCRKSAGEPQKIVLKFLKTQDNIKKVTELELPVYTHAEMIIELKKEEWQGT